jgi:hypothetical protein
MTRTGTTVAQVVPSHERSMARQVGQSNRPGTHKWCDVRAPGIGTGEPRLFQQHERTNIMKRRNSVREFIDGKRRSVCLIIPLSTPSRLHGSLMLAGFPRATVEGRSSAGSG